MMACSWRYRLHEQRCQRSPGQVKACAGAARLAGVIVREGGRLNQPFVAIMSDREREFRGGGAPADLWLAHRPLAQVGGTQNANQNVQSIIDFIPKVKICTLPRVAERPPTKYWYVRLIYARILAI